MLDTILCTNSGEGFECGFLEYLFVGPFGLVDEYVSDYAGPSDIMGSAHVLESFPILKDKHMNSMGGVHVGVRGGLKCGGVRVGALPTWSPPRG